MRRSSCAPFAVDLGVFGKTAEEAEDDAEVCCAKSGT